MKMGLDFEFFENQVNISKLYAETFVKLFNTKIACCDWNNYEKYNDHLKKILLK
jgi:hypothetical protein